MWDIYVTLTFVKKVSERPTGEKLFVHDIYPEKNLKNKHVLCIIMILCVNMQKKIVNLRVTTAPDVCILCIYITNTYTHDTISRTRV